MKINEYDLFLKGDLMDYKKEGTLLFKHIIAVENALE